jgi:hypothetical protein
MKSLTRFLFVALLVALGAVPSFAQTAQATRIQQDPQVLTAATNVQHSHTSAATMTLTANGSNYVYVTGFDISNCEGATTVTVANPTYVTTTGITGSPQYQVGSGPGTAPGVCSPVSSVNFAYPVKSSTPGTNVTFVLPTFATNQTVSINVYYYLSPQ